MTTTRLAPLSAARPSGLAREKRQQPGARQWTVICSVWSRGSDRWLDIELQVSRWLDVWRVARSTARWWHRTATSLGHQRRRASALWWATLVAFPGNHVAMHASVRRSNHMRV